MTVGNVAEAAGVGVETVRYYERRGLVPQPGRAAGAYRRYGHVENRQATVNRIGPFPIVERDSLETGDFFEGCCNAHSFQLHEHIPARGPVVNPL